MTYLGDAQFMGKARSFWLGPTDGAVYTGPVGATYWMHRSWPSTATFQRWCTATGNLDLLTALDAALGG